MQNIVVIWGSTRSRTAPLLRDAESAFLEMDRLYINAYTEDVATEAKLAELLRAHVRRRRQSANRRCWMHFLRGCVAGAPVVVCGFIP